MSRAGWPFWRVVADHMVRGATRVWWDLDPTFAEAGPYAFQLEYGPTGLPGADDWAAVGPPVVGGSQAVDATPREFGATPAAHYRVVLTTAAGTYASPPAGPYGGLGPRDWAIAREVVRKERLRMALAGAPGAAWLLKRRRSGTRPPVPSGPVPASVAEAMTIDPLTGGVLSRAVGQATPTAGADFLGGYYAPQAVLVDVTDPSLDDPADPAAGDAAAAALENACRVDLVPLVAPRDVVALAGSDRRFSVVRVRVVAAWRGVPLVGSLDLAELPFADIVYTIPLPGADAAAAPVPLP